MDQQATPPAGWRGGGATRLEAFVDAAFAFALTLLAIAGDHIPTSGEELWSALRGLPAYAASFLLIVRFWSGHAEWSRRYGLDDAASRRLSLLLVFLVLVFCTPTSFIGALAVGVVMSVLGFVVLRDKGGEAH